MFDTYTPSIRGSSLVILLRHEERGRPLFFQYRTSVLEQWRTPRQKLYLDKNQELDKVVLNEAIKLLAIIQKITKWRIDPVGQEDIYELPSTYLCVTDVTDNCAPTKETQYFAYRWANFLSIMSPYFLWDSQKEDVDALGEWILFEMFQRKKC